jgi:hypothetical protein
MNKVSINDSIALHHVFSHCFLKLVEIFFRFFMNDIHSLEMLLIRLDNSLLVHLLNSFLTLDKEIFFFIAFVFFIIKLVRLPTYRLFHWFTHRLLLC